MRHVLASLLLLCSATNLPASESDEKKPASATLQQALNSYIGPCPSPATIFEVPLQKELPKGLRGTMLQIESDSPYCGGLYMMVTSSSNDYWIGSPWFLEEQSGTAEEKIKRFGWEQMKIPFEAKISRERLVNGLHPVQLVQKSESGNILIDGFVDPAAKMFFVGNFVNPSRGVGQQRLARMENIVATSPTKGPRTAKVSIVEFSDFQCPSCKRAAGFVSPLLTKYGENVRYTRVDLPLVTIHPWAFAAAVFGRAIHRQSPEAFWIYKEAVYAAQDNLNAFTVGDFARGFAADHKLDLERFDKDSESKDLQREILQSAGAAFSVPVVSTPTFLVNGEIVSLGLDGKELEMAIDKALQ